ncbi:hypothetical protein ARMGADRAFT_1048805 [Armillaria gallica]|uniref:CxC2-like cysteine cluster KDZ transposase-associated domain-containing protein n=1 Tax=Armillaria gallica TaxID=47427 RepID=A0A2H3CEK6_ARMGA|nr:hypothetical protein ARMGADRAFT_1048805 [Armillaria gallica]
MPFLEIRNGKCIQVGRWPTVAIYNDGVELLEDFEVIVSHDASISSHSHMVEMPRSPQKGCTTWVMGNHWAPEDDMEIFLDETDAGFYEELTGEVYKSRVFQQANPTQKGKRSCTKVLCWNGEQFKCSSLKDIGLCMQLNHTSMQCHLPVPGHQEFKVLHGNGIHHVALDYCRCKRQLPKHVQLLCRGWFPASHFQLLEFLHLLSLCRRGHVENGVETMQLYDLVILCPSCPWLGMNLPEGWEKAPAELRFLYVLMLCMDANFHLKNQMVSSYSRDLGLGIRWGYFVLRDPYDKFVLNHMSDEDISTCVGFTALVKQDTKFSKGMRYMGVGAVLCAWGEFLIRLVNLHKGERYASMDYAFGSILSSFTELLLVIISYDIACQWFVNLQKHMKDWPSELGIVLENTALTPVIPKFHEPAHKQEGHQEFSCNLIKGMGASDCEVPKWIWGPNNPLRNSMKTIGPGSCQDVLDDNFGFWNWQKYTGMESQRLNLVTEWEKICVEWEDAAFPKTVVENLFAVNQDYMSEEEVGKELEAKEEEHCCQGGRVLHATSADKFVVLGLALEESHLPGDQCRVICMEGLPHIEEKLRTAQCHDALNKICHTLHLKTQMIYFQNKNTWGQALSTRARTVIDGVHRCALTFAMKYHMVHSVRWELSGPGEWEEMLQVLENKDIKSYMDINAKKWGPGLETEEQNWKEGTGEMRCTLSWIWCTTAVNIEDSIDNNEEILWAKWSMEEVLLLREEMCHMLESLLWKVEWWVERQGMRDVRGDEGLAEGLCCFAYDQKELQLRLKAKFEIMWKTPLENMKATLGDSEVDHDHPNEQQSSDDSDSDDGLEDVFKQL